MGSPTDLLAGIGVDKTHPFRKDCEALFENVNRRRYDEAAEHLLRLATQYRERKDWDRNRQAWGEFAMQIDGLVDALRGPLGVRMFRDAVGKVARSRRLSYTEKRLESL
jgi:hypothetical protein